MPEYGVRRAVHRGRRPVRGPGAWPSGCPGPGQGARGGPACRPGPPWRAPHHHHPRRGML